MIARRLSKVAHSEPAVASATSRELYWAGWRLAILRL